MLLLLGCGSPDDGWTWVLVEGAQCANGSSTGMGLRTREGSKDLPGVKEYVEAWRDGQAPFE